MSAAMRRVLRGSSVRGEPSARPTDCNSAARILSAVLSTSFLRSRRAKCASRVINAISRMLVELIVRLRRSRLRAGEHKTTPELSVLKEAEVAASVRRHAGLTIDRDRRPWTRAASDRLEKHGRPSLVSDNREAIAPPEKVSL